jgi:hypothetical protein
VSAASQLAWPTVIIGGAPRSGTSTLFDLLQATGAFRRQSRKELFLLNDPDFWIQAATPGYSAAGEACYGQAGFEPRDRFIDASTTYLYQESAPSACARVLAADPGRSLLAVFCLREPAERLYSNFRYFRDVLMRIPAQATFAAHVESLFDGTSRTGNQQIDAALEHGDYPQYLRRWAASVGERRLLLVRTDALARHPDGVLADIGARLGLPLEAGRPERSNASYRPRFPWLHAIARRIGDAIPHGVLRERLKAAYVNAASRDDGDDAPPGDLAAIERVRLHYRARQADFAAFGLNWYRP